MPPPPCPALQPSQRPLRTFVLLQDKWPIFNQLESAASPLMPSPPGHWPIVRQASSSRRQGTCGVFHPPAPHPGPFSSLQTDPFQELEWGSTTSPDRSQSAPSDIPLPFGWSGPPSPHPQEDNIQSGVTSCERKGYDPRKQAVLWYLSIRDVWAPQLKLLSDLKRPEMVTLGEVDLYPRGPPEPGSAQCLVMIKGSRRFSLVFEKLPL